MAIASKYQMPYAATQVGIDNESMQFDNTQFGIGSTHTPLAFRPIVLDKAIREKYLYAEGLRKYFTTVNMPLGFTAYRWLEYDNTTGEIDWLNEYDVPPLIDETYTEKQASIRSYGWKIAWTDLEERTNRYDMINQRIDSGINKMVLREDAATLAAMDGAATTVADAGHQFLANAMTISDWSAENTGTPAKDIVQMRRRIRDNTKHMYTGNTLIMNSNMLEYLMDYDFVQNNQYTSFMFNQTGLIPSIAGMFITLVESVADNTCYIFQSGVCGEWLVSDQLQTRPFMPSPRLKEQWMWMTAAPIVRMPRVIVKGSFTP